MKPQSLVEWISDAGVSCVTLTGGEPTLQPGLPALILALLGSDAWGSGNGRAVEIETNGAVDLSALHELRSEFGKKRATDHCAAIDGIDCGAMPLVPCGDAVKFVVASIEDLECAKSVIEQYDLCARCEVFFSPVFSCIEPSEIVSFMERHGLFGVRLQLQLHKIIWPDRDRGV